MPSQVFPRRISLSTNLTQSETGTLGGLYSPAPRSPGDLEYAAPGKNGAKEFEGKDDVKYFHGNIWNTGAFYQEDSCFVRGTGIVQGGSGLRVDFDLPGCVRPEDPVSHDKERTFAIAALRH